MFLAFNSSPLTINSSQTSDYSTNNSRNHGLTAPQSGNGAQGVTSSSQQPPYGYNNFQQPATHYFGGGVAR